MSTDSKKVGIQAKPFKRLNFFNGFFTTAKDWQDGEKYHIEKRKLHNRGMHTPGILYGGDSDSAEDGSLRVSPKDGAQFTVEIAPGAALDRDGNLLLLPTKAEQELKEKLTELGKNNKPLFIGIKFLDEQKLPEDEVKTGESSDHTRITECATVVVLEQEDADPSAVLLASVTMPANNASIQPENIIDQRKAVGPKGLKKIRDLIQANRDYHEDQVKKLTNRIQANRDYHNDQVEDLKDQIQKNRNHHNAQVAHLDDLLQRLGKTVGENSGQIIDLQKELQKSVQRIDQTVADNRTHADQEAAVLNTQVQTVKQTVADNRVHHDNQVTGLTGSLQTVEQTVTENRAHHDSQSAILGGALAALGATVAANDAKQTTEWHTLRETVAQNLSRHLSDFDFLGDAINALDQQVVENQALHDRGLHTPGILHGQGENLLVEAYAERQINVRRGLALDAFGRLIEVTDKRNLLDIPIPKRPDLLYVVAAADTTTINAKPPFIYPAKLSIQERAADPTQGQLELARIHVAPDAAAINNAQNPAQPRINEIDHTYIVWAGAVNREADRRLALLEEILFQRLHTYQRQMRQELNQGLRTPGIVPHIGTAAGKELAVVAYKGLTIQVQPGLAIDAAGHELRLLAPRLLPVELPKQLPHIAYITIQHQPLLNAPDKAPQALYQLDDTESVLDVRFQQPDNELVIELARIHLSKAVLTTGITNPHAGPPRDNEIDRRAIHWAGALAPHAAKPLPEPLRERLISQLSADRQDFTALAEQFPTLALDELRHALINLEMSVRARTIVADQLPDGLALIATTLTEVVTALGKRYPTIRARTVYQAFDAASEAYRQAFAADQTLDELLNRQAAVAASARRLAGLTLRRPTAQPEQTTYQATTNGSYATVRLKIQATADQGQTIKSYRLFKRSA